MGVQLSTDTKSDTLYVVSHGFVLGTVTRKILDNNDVHYIIIFHKSEYEDYTRAGYKENLLDLYSATSPFVKTVESLPRFLKCALPSPHTTLSPMVRYGWQLDRWKNYDSWEYLKLTHRYCNNDSIRVATYEELQNGRLNFICNDGYLPEVKARIKLYMEGQWEEDLAHD